MANLTAKNPVLVQGPVMERVKLLCANNQSWNAGQFLHLVSGLLTASATDAVNSKYYALATQAATGTTADVYAEVGIITAEHVFEMFEKEGTVGDANKGQLYPINVTANLVTFDVDDNTTPCLILIDVASNYEPSRNVAADVKGRARLRFLQSVLDT